MKKKLILLFTLIFSHITAFGSCNVSCENENCNSNCGGIGFYHEMYINKINKIDGIWFDIEKIAQSEYLTIEEKRSIQKNTNYTPSFINWCYEKTLGSSYNKSSKSYKHSFVFNDKEEVVEVNNILEPKLFDTQGYLKITTELQLMSIEKPTDFKKLVLQYFKKEVEGILTSTNFLKKMKNNFNSGIQWYKCENGKAREWDKGVPKINPLFNGRTIEFFAYASSHDIHPCKIGASGNKLNCSYSFVGYLPDEILLTKEETLKGKKTILYTTEKEYCENEGINDLPIQIYDLEILDKDFYSLGHECKAFSKETIVKNLSESIIEKTNEKIIISSKDFKTINALFFQEESDCLNFLRKER